MLQQPQAADAGGADAPKKRGPSAKATGTHIEYFATEILPTLTPECNDVCRLTRLQRRFSSAGFALHPLDGSVLLVQRWGLRRTLPDLAAAEKWLAHVGAAR